MSHWRLHWATACAADGVALTVTRATMVMIPATTESAERAIPTPVARLPGPVTYSSSTRSPVAVAATIPIAPDGVPRGSKHLDPPEASHAGRVLSV